MTTTRRAARIRDLACAGLILCLAACAAPSRARTAPQPAWLAIGTSVQARAIEARTFGDGAYRIYLIGGIHGDEHEGGRFVDELCERLGRADLAGVTLRVVRDLNPDGTAAGTRSNARGVDLNRNWPASNFAPAAARGLAPLSEPETLAAHADVEAFAPDLVVILHAARRGPFVNYDGPAEALAELFADAARAADARWRPVAEMGYATPGSLGSWAGKDARFPVLTIEFERGGDPERARLALFNGMDALLAVAAR